MVIVKGHEINLVNIKNPSYRRAQQFQNDIINALKKLSVDPEDVEFEECKLVLRKFPACVSWYQDGFFLNYLYSKEGRFIDNLYVVKKLIEIEVNLVLEGKKAIDEFIKIFEQDENIIKLRKRAREILGVSVNCTDFREINSKYKKLAKELHPDKDFGDAEKFKEINKMFQILKKELE